MNILPKSKFGDCVECGAKDTACVKVGKELFCLECRANAKRKQQIQKHLLSEKVKRLADKQDHSAAERQMLMHDLDFVFSRYIRIKEADALGNSMCYTCGKKMNWKKLQLGHYIKRADTLLRWDSRNGRSQCYNCNCSLHGNIEVYTQKLNEEHPGLPEQLKEESRDVNKFSRDELKQLLIDLRHKLRLVENKLIE